MSFDDLKGRHGRHVHPYVPELANDFLKGRVDRRSFLRTATLLGVAAAAAYGFAGRLSGEGPIARALAETPRQGGVLRFAMQVPEAADPATYDWTQKANIACHVIEYLTYTDAENVTHPYLTEGWEASEDLRRWTFYLRKEVTWSNGDAFTAEDVIFNFRRWLDPATGSSNLSLFSAMTEQVNGESRMREGAIERLDDHTVRLNLAQPVLSIPENLFAYPCGIVHRRFEEEGGDLMRNPVGTGPFTVERFAVGEEAYLVRRDQPYWGGEVYLDAIHYIDTGEDDSAAVAALASGQVDGVYRVDTSTLDTVERLPDIQVNEAVSAQTGVSRFRLDTAPFDDLRVRKAIVLCCDNQRIFDLVHRGRGLVAENHHVAPIHPEYAKLPAPRQDYDQARALLEEAGHGEGLTIEGVVGNAEGPWESAQMQAIQEMLEPAGIRMNLNVMPTAQYWDVWDQVPFGLTTWAHRPLGVQTLAIAYRSGAAWNETRYANPDFDALVAEAEQTLDVEERRGQMERLQKMLQDDAVMIQPFWRALFDATHSRVKGYEMNPTRYHGSFRQVWLAEDS